MPTKEQLETTSGKKITLFAITWPIFIEVLLHILMGNADTLMLSQYSDDAVAAVGVANQIITVIIVMFGFVATGTSILIAQHLGAHEDYSAKKIAVVSLGANLVFGIFLSVLLFFFSSTILKAMNLPVELLDTAMVYLQIVGGFVFVQALIMTAGAILRSYRFTKDAMYVTVAMNIVNVIGNYLFIFGPFGIPVLGVTGVAIVTTVTRFLGIIILMILLYKRIKGHLPLSYLKTFPKKELSSLLKIGVPSAGEQLSYNMSQVVVTFFIAIIGTEALTTKVYAQNIMVFILIFSVAIGQGNQIMIGYQIGAKQVEEAYKRCIRSVKIAIFLSLGMAVIFSIFRESLLSIFTDNSDIIAIGSVLILLTIILEPGRAFNLVIINALRAVGDVNYPVFMGILSMWGVSVTLSYLLGIHFGLGLIGIWIAFIADEWLRGLLMLRRWKKRKWQSMSL